MARRYVVQSGLTSLAASTTKVACQLATGSTITTIIIGFDITFDSVATGAGAIPIRVQLSRPTAAGSGGSTFTPSKMMGSFLAAAATARINDTTAGSSPLVLAEWLISPTGGITYLFPLGREIEMKESDFLELKVVSQAGMTTCNYQANLWFEE